MDDTVIAYNFFILAIMFIVYRLIAYLSLLYVAGEWLAPRNPTLTRSVLCRLLYKEKR